MSENALENLIDAIPEEQDIDEETRAELDEFAEQMVNGESTLPVDTGLEVIVRPVPGALDEWEESHLHVDPLEQALVMHLCPEDAGALDAKHNEFLVRRILDGAEYRGDADD